MRSDELEVDDRRKLVLRREDRRAAHRSARRAPIGETLPVIRLIYVAALTGMRFAREGIASEPLDWMTQPNETFDGLSPLVGCQSPEGVRRAILLHELSLGLHCNPSLLRELPATNFVGPAASHRLFAPLAPHHAINDDPGGRKELYTVTIVSEGPDGIVQIFCAMMANSPGEVRQRLRARYGALLEDAARVRLGFDPSEPFACSLLSEALSEILSLVSQDPACELAEGLDLKIEQRFIH